MANHKKQQSKARKEKRHSNVSVSKKQYDELYKQALTLQHNLQISNVHVTIFAKKLQELNINLEELILSEFPKMNEANKKIEETIVESVSVEEGRVIQLNNPMEEVVIDNVPLTQEENVNITE